MSNFTPTTPIALQIRKIIFEKFNDVDVNFTNDDVFEILKENGDFDPSWIIDDTESFFNEISKFPFFIIKICSSFSRVSKFDEPSGISIKDSLTLEK